MIIEIAEGHRFPGCLTDAVRHEPEVVIVMPALDAEAAARSASLMAHRCGIAGGLLVEVRDADRQGFVALANAVFAASCSRYFGYVAQDAYAGRLWLRRAIETLDRTGKGLLAFNDGKWFGALAAFGLARRDWARGNYGGALFHDAYRGHYADVELTLLAMQSREIIYDPNCVLVEVDWEKHRKPVGKDDRAVFHERSATGFDGRVSSPDLLTLFS